MRKERTNRWAMTRHQVYRTGSGGGDGIVDKFNTTAKTLSEIATNKRGSAVQLLKQDYLKLDVLLS